MSDINPQITSPHFSAMSDSLRSHGLQPARLLCPWDFPGRDTGVVCHFLLQGIFPTQGLNLGLLHSRQIFYHLSHQEKLTRHKLLERKNLILLKFLEFLLNSSTPLSTSLEEHSLDVNNVILTPDYGLEF